LALAAEVLGQAGAVGPLLQHLIAGIAVSLSLNGALRSAWLGKLARGEVVATLALGGEWLPESWTVLFDGQSVSGRVAFVPGAAAADFFVVGVAGGGLVLVEKGAGVIVSPVASSDRTRRVSEVVFERTPAVGLIAAGDADGARVFDAALVLTAADALGGAQRCVDMSIAYAKEREQFGQPIGRFQALKHQLATMALEVEPARALLWYAAYAYDAALPDARRAAAMAKAHIADRFVSVARAAVAAHGGIGYTWDYGLGIWFRRSLADRAYLGSPSVHRARAAELGGW
jgi:alkylation response protein AidB-like acyl-CoA dehydrogenase